MDIPHPHHAFSPLWSILWKDEGEDYACLRESVAQWRVNREKGEIVLGGTGGYFGEMEGRKITVRDKRNWIIPVGSNGDSVRFIKADGSVEMRLSFT